MAGSWTNRCGNAQRWPLLKEDYGERSVGSKRDYPLGILPTGCAITADLRCQQLDQVTAKLQGKQDRFDFLQDNARPHVAKSTCEKILRLEWVTVSHPSYSPDLAAKFYHLFRSLSNYLRKENPDDKNDLKMYLVNFFGH